jgi:hypothetical protein
MDPDIQKIAQLLVMVSAFSTFVVTLAIIARFGFRKTRAPSLPAREADARIDESRFARLEDAVDSIAIEVERIAEAQRFTAKLMSERLPDRLPESTTDRAQQR